MVSANFERKSRKLLSQCRKAIGHMLKLAAFSAAKLSSSKNRCLLKSELSFHRMLNRFTISSPVDFDWGEWYSIKSLNFVTKVSWKLYSAAFFHSYPKLSTLVAVLISAITSKNTYMWSDLLLICLSISKITQSSILPFVIVGAVTTLVRLNSLSKKICSEEFWNRP